MVNAITSILNMFVALLFFLPFSMKLRNFGKLRVEIYAYGLLPATLLTLAGYAVLVLEFVLYFLFSTGLAGIWKCMLGAGVLVAFSWLTWRKRKNADHESCSCFGEIDILNRNPITRNMVIIGILFIDACFKQEQRDVNGMIHTLVLVVALSVSIEMLHDLKKKRDHYV